MKSSKKLIGSSIGVLTGFIIAVMVKGFWTGEVDWEKVVNIAIGGFIGMVILFMLISSSDKEKEK